MDYKTYGIKPFLISLFKRDKWDLLSKIDILFVDHDGHRSYNLDGKMFAPLIDSFQESFDPSNFKFLTIAEPYSQITFGKAHGKVIDFNGSFARCAIIRKIRLLFKNEKYPGEFGYRYLWKKILDKTQPRLVVAIMPSESLCLACSENRILVADLQHGVIADKHPWYGAIYKINTPTNLLPNIYLCWDQQSAEVLLKWTISKGIFVRVIGNPWYIGFAKILRSRASYKERLFKDFNISNDLPTILITLGWDFMQYNSDYFTKKYSREISFEQNAGFSLGLLELIKRTFNLYNWRIRLHPVQINGEEFKIVNKFLSDNLAYCQNVDWIESSKLPLPFILENIDLHITFCSTIVSEAAIFGVKSAILVPFPKPNDWLESYFLQELSSGMASYVFNIEEEIENWISHNLYTKIIANKLNNSDYYEFIDSVSAFLKSESNFAIH